MIERVAVVAEDAAGVAADVRGLVPAPGSVADSVAGIIASIRDAGDDALLMHERRFGTVDGPIRVPGEELAAALEALDPAVRSGLELGCDNVRRVAAAALGADTDVELPRARSCAYGRSRSGAPRCTPRAGAIPTRPRS